jgi:hypothetical protein
MLEIRINSIKNADFVNKYFQEQKKAFWGLPFSILMV